MGAPLGNQHAKKENPLSSTIWMRVTPEDKARLVGMAQSRGLKLADFILKAVDFYADK